MILITFLLIFFILLVIGLKDWLFNYIKLLQTYGNIPCPRNRLPLFGNLFDLPMDNYEITKKILKYHEEYKDSSLFCLWLGPYPYLTFHRPVELEHFFGSSKHITETSDYDFLHPWLGTGLLTSDGTKWKNRRRIITPAFHDKDLLNNFVDIFNEQTVVFIQRLSSIKSGEATNLSPYIAACTLDIICEAAMGLNIGAQQKRNLQYVDAILKMTEIVLKRQRMPWMWPDLLFKLQPQGREHDRCLNIIHSFTRKVIEDRAETFHANNTRGKRSAFLDLLLKQMHDERLTLGDIQEEVDTFMFEGHDTTATSIHFTCFMIALHADVQQKLHEEIDRVFGNDKDRPCTMDDLNELNYLECVIKETLRVYPPVPMIGRKVQEDFVYNNVKILRDTPAVIFTYRIHRDERYYPDPERFDPDRFLPENSTNRPPYAFIPFSAGSRNCIGQRFAMLEEKVILSWLLRRFKLKTSQTREELKINFELLLRCENELFVNLESRE